MTDPVDIVERLRDEYLRLASRSIDRGCADSGIASNVASDAEEEITRLRAENERLREALHYANGVTELAIKHRNEAERSQASAVAAETERCAAIADSFLNTTEILRRKVAPHEVSSVMRVIDEIAAAIRSGTGRNQG